jgi:hypothetical protein
MNTPGFTAEMSLNGMSVLRYAGSLSTYIGSAGVKPQLRILDLNNQRDCIMSCYIYTGDLGGCYQACFRRYP